MAMSREKLLIRMYDVGFGDCFLLVVPGTPKRSILVDAGFHAQGKGSFAGTALAEQVILDVTRLTGKKRIDVVIATHRHQDHVFSFNAKVWDELDVGEVWMPWVEDPKNAAARKLWKKQAAFRAQLAAALPGFQLTPEDAREADFLLWNAGVGPGPKGFEAWSNADALERLRHGFASRDLSEPRYLPMTEAFPETFQSEALPGVRVVVLGPSRDPELIAELDPERDGETYRALALRAAEGPARGAIPSPFSEAWTAAAPEDGSLPPLLPEEEERLRALARSADPMFAARALDDMINATSLVFVLQIGRARLLLPGDAEWGTWKRILADDGARALLAGTTFFKIGHHGSHNGTPKSLVEEVLPEGLSAMLSTQKGPGTYRNDIPLDALLKALGKHGVRVVRSDEKGKRLPAGFKREAAGRWVDLTLTC
jgi:beta-lactamase superfamily II metal-dependent hydrolase